MALGEQFESQAVNHTPTGSFGQRIFIELWHDRYKSTLPKIGDPWPPDTLHTPPFTEGLWCHEIVPSPYAASGTKLSNDNVATHVRLEYNYESSPPLTSEVIFGWRVSTSGVTASVEIGKERAFVNHPKQNIDGGKPRQVPMIEVVIRGLEYLGGTQGIAAEKLSGLTADAQDRLGTVCHEIYRPTAGVIPVRGQVLFESEDTGEPFMRRTCLAAEHQPTAWYREYSRRFLIKRIPYEIDVNTIGIAGHNQEWNSTAKEWDTVTPGLYPEVAFGPAGPRPAIFPV
ncbi:MAG: hypothetical protein ABIH03_15415 [Pseudomonadota bacterium]